LPYSTIKDINNDQELSSEIHPKSLKTIGDHPPKQIIEDTSGGIRTRLSFINNNGSKAMISHIKPKKYTRGNM